MHSGEDAVEQGVIPTNTSISIASNIIFIFVPINLKNAREAQGAILRDHRFCLQISGILYFLVSK